MEYSFKDKTGKIVRFDIRISEYDAFKADHPELERYFETAPAFVYDGRPVSGFDSRTDDGFKEVLSKISDAHPHSPLADRYRRKTTKEVKTRALVKKHLDKRASQIREAAARRGR
jgi:hypothetical protein